MDGDIDLCMLPELSDLHIVECIQERYKHGIVCTRLGQSCLISVNAAHLQSPAITTAPDVTTFAARAASELVSTEEDHTIIVYGGSASGKTRTTFAIIQSLLKAKGSASLIGLVNSALHVSAAFTHTVTASNAERSTATDVWSCRYSGSLLCGVELSSLLLDAELVLNASRGGCATHVIRYLMRGLPTLQLEGLGINTPPSATTTTTTETESKGFQELERSLETLGFSEEERRGIWCVLEAVVLLTRESPDVKKVSSLLCVEEGAEMESIGHTPRLPQWIYMSLYKWILHRMNSAMTQECPSETVQLYIVDPVGHECTSVGSFHQLLCGYVEETLLNIQWMRTYEWEQAQYLEEEIVWERVEVPNRCGLLHDFNRVGGLLECLEERLLSSVITMVTAVTGSSADICPTKSPDFFIVVHYTGEQTYGLEESWVTINHSHTPQNVIAILERSTHPVVQALAKTMVRSQETMLGESVSSSCLSRRVRISLDILEEHITSSSPYFVYCLCPSEDTSSMLQQVQHFQLMDIALMLSTGYPVHISIEVFVDRYGNALLFEKSLPMTAEVCTRILKSSGIDHWCVGRTKVFLKPWHLEQLEGQLAAMNRSAKIMQRAFRRHDSLTKSKDNKLDVTTSLSLPHGVSFLSEGVGEEPPPTTYMIVLPNEGRGRRKRPSWARDKSILRPNVHAHTHPSSVISEPNLSRDLAEEALIRARADCFLIRESEPQGTCTLSLKHVGMVKHFRILQRESSGRYCLNGSCASFGSLASLVTYYSHNCVTSAGELLEYPCRVEDHPPCRVEDHTPSHIEAHDSSDPPPLPPRRLLTMRKSPNSGIPHKTKSLGVLPSKGKIRSLTCTQDIDESMEALKKELEHEEKMMLAAKRLANMPGSPKDKQQRNKGLADAQSRFFKLQQQYHSLQDQKKIIGTL